MLFEQTRVRVIGVCFGHQVIGRALGVEVKRNEKGWEAGILPVPLLPRGKYICSTIQSGEGVRVPLRLLAAGEDRSTPAHVTLIYIVGS